MKNYEEELNRAREEQRRADSELSACVDSWVKEYESQGETLRERIAWKRSEGLERANEYATRHAELSRAARVAADRVAVARYNCDKKRAGIIAAALVAVFKKYDGKQYGERTRAKMCDEVRAATGAWFSVVSGVWSREAGHVKADGFDFSAADENGERVNIRDANNTLHAAPAFHVWGFGHDYIDNPDEYIKRMDELRTEAEAAQAVAQKAKRSYNEERIDGIATLRD